MASMQSLLLALASKHSKYLRSLDTSFLFGYRSEAHAVSPEGARPKLSSQECSGDAPCTGSAGLCGSGRRSRLRTDTRNLRLCVMIKAMQIEETTEVCYAECTGRQLKMEVCWTSTFLDSSKKGSLRKVPNEVTYRSQWHQWDVESEGREDY